MWDQSTRTGQGISVMKQSVPVGAVIHLSWVQSELRWCEGTIIKHLQAKGYLKSIGVDIRSRHVRGPLLPSASWDPRLGKNSTLHMSVILQDTHLYLFSLGSEIKSEIHDSKIKRGRELS